MKRLSFLMCSALLLSFLCIITSAGSQGQKFANGDVELVPQWSILIDGVKDAAYSTTANFATTSIHPASHDNVGGTSSCTYVLWDGYYLYLLTEVKDSTTSFATSMMDYMYQGGCWADCVEYFIAWQNGDCLGAQKWQANSMPDVNQYRVVPTPIDASLGGYFVNCYEDEQGFGTYADLQFNFKNEPGFISAGAFTTTSSGYIVETKIMLPRTDKHGNGNFIYVNGTKIGICVQLYDAYGVGIEYDKMYIALSDPTGTSADYRNLNHGLMQSAWEPALYWYVELKCGDELDPYMPETEPPETEPPETEPPETEPPETEPPETEPPETEPPVMDEPVYGSFNGFNYMIYKSKVTILSYEGPEKELIIPDLIEDTPVTCISALAFGGQDIEKIVIPYSVELIDSEAFEGCKHLSSVEMSDGLRTIGEYVFESCISLTSISIPGSVEYIGVGAFYGCSSLSSVQLNEGIKTIGSHSFEGCISLTNIIIPGSVEYYDSAFSGCSSLSDVQLTEGIKTIDYRSFENCISLKNIVIPESVETVCYAAFRGCTGLNSMILPNGVQSVNGYALSECNNLKSVFIPNSVTYIAENAFQKCYRLDDITVSENNPNYYSVSNCLIEKSSKTLIIGSDRIPENEGIRRIAGYAFYGRTGISSISIPQGVTEIGEYAFYYCINLRDLSLPDSLISIGDKAFGFCSSLEIADMTDTLSSIGYGAFIWCTNLTSIRISTGLSSLPGYVFYRCIGLTNIDIPNNVKRIEGYAFGDCTGLYHVHVSNVLDTDISYTAFDGCINLYSIDFGENDFAPVKPVKLISVYSNPIKTSYSIGEPFDSTGFVLKVVYTDDTIDYLSEGMSFSGFSSEDAGTKTIIVSFHGKTAAFTVTVNSEEELESFPKVWINNADIIAGEEFTVDVMIANNPGIVGMTIEVGYDSDIFELVDTEEVDFPGLSFGPITSNPFTVCWEDVLNEDNHNNGILVRLKFAEKGYTPKNTVLTVSYEKDSIFNYTLDSVDFLTGNGVIQIMMFKNGDVNHDGSVNLKDYVLLKRFVNGWLVEIDEDIADVNSDMVVNLKDYALLKRFVNGWDIVLSHRPS